MRKTGIIAASIVIAAVGALGCAAGDGTNVTRPTKVTITVIGAGLANVTYGTVNGVQQVADAPLPWLNEVTGRAGFDVISVNAQRKSDDGGEIKCSIKSDDKVLHEATSSGPYAIVMCSATL